MPHALTPEQIARLPYRRNVGAMVLNREGGVFVGQRLDMISDAWQMPQGGIDKDEEPGQAVLRELVEETGITANLVDLVAQSDDWLTYDLPAELVPRIWKGRYRGQKQKWYLLRFLGTDDQIDIATEHPEFSRWRWLPVDRLVDNIVPFKREVYARVIDDFAAHLT
jgi:putative (di)nucleoside polyphosphate hydrolase